MEATSLNLMANTIEHEAIPFRWDWFATAVLGIQTAFIVFFFVFCRYAVVGDSINDVKQYWPFLRDVTVMLFVGFGYLMTFLKRHRFSSIGYTFFIGVVIVQWNILVTGFFTYILSRGSTSGAISSIDVGFPQLILAMFGAASVLVSFGVWIGKIGPEQLLVLGLLHTLFYSVNAYIIEGLLHVRDVGGTMVIHMFGAYFGLAAVKFLSPSDLRQRSLYAGASYTSDSFSMVGTVFLWIFWPSFNSALVPDERQYLAIINTVLSLCACAMVSFALSRMLRRRQQFTMEDLQNATIAGGVVMGASADMLTSPGASLLLGALGGTLSVGGFALIGPKIQRRLGIYDTCGVHNLHGMPAVLGSLASAIAASQAEPAVLASFTNGASQWGYQLAAMCITLLIAIAGGLMCGLLVAKLGFIPKPQGQLFDDEQYFELPDTYEAGVAPMSASGLASQPMQEFSEPIRKNSSTGFQDSNRYESVIDL